MQYVSSLHGWAATERVSHLVLLFRDDIVVSADITKELKGAAIKGGHHGVCAQHNVMSHAILVLLTLQHSSTCLMRGHSIGRHTFASDECLAWKRTCSWFDNGLFAGVRPKYNFT